MGENPFLNGYGKKIDEIQADVSDIKDHLADAISDHRKAIDHNTNAINVFAMKLEHIYNHSLNAIPLRFVVYFFFMLMLAFDRGELAKALLAAITEIKALIWG